MEVMGVINKAGFGKVALVTAQAPTSSEAGKKKKKEGSQ